MLLAFVAAVLLFLLGCVVCVFNCCVLFVVVFCVWFVCVLIVVLLCCCYRCCFDCFVFVFVLL